MTAPAALRTDNQADVLTGLGFVLAAMIVLPAQDTVAKYLSAGISPGEITWARFLLQSAFTLPLLLYFHGVGGLVPKRLWPNALRGALIAGSSTAFFAALKFMPIADALAIFFIEPFILTILSAVIDKEHVGWRRRIAVATGFVGVLIVVQPSWGVFGPVSLIPALGGTLFAVYMLLNRRLTAHDPPLTMQFTAGVTAFLILTAALAVGWLVGTPEFLPAPVAERQILLLLLMGVFGTSGHLLFVEAARLAPSSLIAPMQYVEIICAALFGYLFFGDFPSLSKWLGIAIIVASGAYVFWRESRVRAEPSQDAARVGKAALVNHMAREHGYRRYLEIHVPSTGHHYREVDRSLLRCERLTYNCPKSWRDRYSVDFRSTDFDISAIVERLQSEGRHYDVILVDPWHGYDTSLRDIRLAYELLSPGGTMVVHDCLPPREEVAGPEPKDGDWCGVTYKAFLDFVLGAGLDYCVVDTDWGCGIVRKPLGPDAHAPCDIPVPPGEDREALARRWRDLGDDYDSAFRMLHAHPRAVARVVSVEEFLALEPRL